MELLAPLARGDRHWPSPTAREVPDNGWAARPNHRNALATTLRSATSISYAARRPSESGARSTAEGWIVAITFSASGLLSTWPRCAINLNCDPITDWAAVAPRQTRTTGRTALRSAPSHGRHALTSDIRGFL